MPKATIARSKGASVAGVSCPCPATCASASARRRSPDGGAHRHPAGRNGRSICRVSWSQSRARDLLGGDDLDAETAERWGYLNRCFEADEIGPFVDALARRIASFPADAIRLAKASVDAAEGPLDAGMKEEAFNFQQTLRTEAAQDNMRRFMAAGGQTREVELRVGAVAGEIARNRD